MPISPEDAGAEIQRFITGLNASKHVAREKALKAFRAFVEKQGMEFYDDDVDSLLLGDGYTMGLMQWCGESSTGTQGALKRTAATAISLLKWLVSLRDPSGDENIFLARFLQVALEDLSKMRLELHLLITGSHKGSKASSRGGKSEEACEIVSLILQRHRDDLGEAEEISVEELLPEEDARKIFVNWLQQTAMGKQDTLRLNPIDNDRRKNPDVSVGGSKEVSGRGSDEGIGEAANEGPDGFNGDDTPLTWAEVDQEQFVVLNSRVSPVVAVDMATKADEPVVDPLGLKQVDLRVYQKTLVEGDTSAVVEVDGADLEMPGTLQAKKRALLGQKDRLRLLKKMQSGKERVQRKMERGRSSKSEGVRGGEIGSIPESKPVTREISRSVVPTMEDFDPALFMTVLHATASFSDIRNGLESLNGAKANQASELQHLVRDHFDSFVRCADSIEKYASHINLELSKNMEQPKEKTATRPKTLAQLRMQLKLEREAESESHPGGGEETWTGAGPAAKSHLTELTRLMEGARTEAGKNFSQLLQKLDNIKQASFFFFVRAAQHLLSEKGSILDIPREMSACMADGRYMDLVKLYRKAHTTYSSSILSKVRVEAGAVAQQACIRLVEILRSPDVSLEEQVDAVGYLQDLKYEGQEPLQACFDSQKENFLENAIQCREAMETLLLEAFAYRQAGGRSGRSNDEQQQSRYHKRRSSWTMSPARSSVSKSGSTSEDFTDSEVCTFGLAWLCEKDFSPTRSLNRGNRFFDFHDGHVLLAMDMSDDDSFYENNGHLEDDRRSDGMAGRVRVGLQELQGMELDEDLALPLAPGVDVLTHRISLARLQHVSNLAWCLGSWLPHLVSLAVLLIRMEHSQSGRATEEGGGQPSPHVHIRKLCGPGAYTGGTSDFADGDTASIATSGPRAASTAHEASSTLESDDSFVTGKRDRVGTKAESEITKLFERWLNSTTSVLRAAIFGDNTVSDKNSSSRNSVATAGRVGHRLGSSTISTTGRADAPLFAGNMQGGLSNKYAGEPHLKDPLDPRYLRQAFSSLAHLYDSLSQVLGGSWEGDMVLSPGLRALEKLVKEAQALHVRSEMAALATEAKALMDVDPWLAPEPPHPPGGTRLPHLFGALAHQRMTDLVELLPRAEWSAAEVTHGLSDAVQCLLSCVTALGTRAYEASRVDHSNGALLARGGGTTTTGGHHGEEGFSADHQLLCQIGNCLQLDAVILPELWDTAVDLFDASRAGVVSDRKRTQKVQEKVMNKYLKRKYRELKMYVKNGWWGYARPAPRSGRQDGSISEGMKHLSHSDRASTMRDQRRVSTITRQRTSLRLKRGTFTHTSGGSTASVARQASMLSSKGGTSSGKVTSTHGGSVVNRRTGLKAAPNISVRTPKPQSLPSYMVKVLLSLVQARLEAQEALRGLLYRRAGMHDGKMRKDILYADFVLRESARQASVMEIVCDCANARVVGEGHLGAKPLDGSDPVEQAEKIAQAEFLRDALYRFLPSATLDRVNRVIARLQAGKFEGTLGRSAGNNANSSSSSNANPQGSGSARDGLVRVGSLRQGRSEDGAAAEQTGNPASSVSTSDKKQASVSDSLAAAMPGSFLTATDLQELARVYVVCLK
ncbi:unnamed protein product [Pylaiella littoralis]